LAEFPKLLVTFGRYDA